MSSLRQKMMSGVGVVIASSAIVIGMVNYFFTEKELILLALIEN